MLNEQRNNETSSNLLHILTPYICRNKSKEKENYFNNNILLI